MTGILEPINFQEAKDRLQAHKATHGEILRPSEGCSLGGLERGADILDFTQYRDRRNAIQNHQSNNRRARRSMNYLRNKEGQAIKFEKTLTEFPTNAEFELDNSAVIKTRLYGEDELYISELQSKKVLGADGKTLEPAYDSAAFMLKVLSRVMVSWTFADENGVVYPITEANISALVREDFDYLAGEFGKVMEGYSTPSGKQPEGEDAATAPHTEITEQEKN